MSADTLEITYILPPNDEPVDFDALDCDAVGADINLVEDSELSIKSPPQVVEIMGPETKLIFYPNCKRPLLAMHFKSMKRFVSFFITCVDDNKKKKCFEISNKNSFVTIDDFTCKMPLEIESGWQYVCLDLEELMGTAFGVSYAKCASVEIRGSCRLSKLFFQSQKYADIELPKFLRVIV